MDTVPRFRLICCELHLSMCTNISQTPWCGQYNQAENGTHDMKLLNVCNQGLSKRKTDKYDENTNDV